MKAPSITRTPLGATLLVIVLVASSALGLLAGTLTHTFTAASQTPPTSGVNPGGIRQPSATPTQTATSASPTTEGATATSAPITSAFILTIHATPNTGAPGQQISILVTAQTIATSAPLTGLTCFLRGPTQGGKPLLQNWPTPVVTDANGQASWRVVIPQEAPGVYRVETVAQLQNDYSYFAYTSVTVTG